MKRGLSAKVGARNHNLLATIGRLKGNHPFWGYLRVWANLPYVE